MSNTQDAAIEQPPRRSLTIAIVLLGGGSFLLLFAAGRVWVTGSVTDPGSPVVRVMLSGHAVSGAATAFGLLGLAGGASTLLLRGLPRRVLAIALAVALAAGAATIANVGAHPGARVRESANVTGGILRATTSGWPWVATASALAAAVGAVLLARRVPGTRSRTRAQAPDLWAALERGEDPTA